MRTQLMYLVTLLLVGCSTDNESFFTPENPSSSGDSGGGGSSSGGGGSASGGGGSSSGGGTSSGTGGAGGDDCGCSLPNAVPVCLDGWCYIDHCISGFEDCNGERLDGCEIQTSIDVNNCGVCANQCHPKNTSAACVGGQCACVMSGTVCQCDAQTGDCDNDRENGCEALTDSDDNNCGVCGYSCNNTAYCQNSQCICDGMAYTYPAYPQELVNCTACITTSCCDVFQACLADSTCANGWQAYVNCQILKPGGCQFSGLPGTLGAALNTCRLQNGCGTACGL